MRDSGVHCAWGDPTSGLWEASGLVGHGHNPVWVPGGLRPFLWRHAGGALWASDQWYVPSPWPIGETESGFTNMIYACTLRLMISCLSSCVCLVCLPLRCVCAQAYSVCYLWLVLFVFMYLPYTYGYTCAVYVHILWVLYVKARWVEASRPGKWLLCSAHPGSKIKPWSRVCETSLGENRKL